MSEVEKRGDGASFLVRLWREPAGTNTDEHAPRVYVRDLRSGRETYLNSVSRLTDFLERHDRARRDAAEGLDLADGRRRAG